VEDSTTGSAHCSLGVVYAPRFDAIEKPLTATQGGRRRGRITMVWDGKAGKDGGRMKLRGNTVTGKLVFKRNQLGRSLTTYAQWHVASFMYE
jgi:predicted PhzF superfamily epimerase YddE/YHI9